jgi:beta-galactosidase
MLNQRKGLFQIKPNFNIDAIFMKLAPLFPEDIFSAPPKAADVSVGYIFAANFTLKPEEIADSYLDMRNYTKGALYINGRNIGRHWNIGPQYRLYVPGVWLKTQNVLAVFD